MGFDKNKPETGIGIKKPNQVEYISKDEWEARIQSIAKAKRNIAWWAETFFKIVTLDKGLTSIKLYQKQKELLEFIAGNNRILTLASRQTGKTTTYTIFCLWYATLFQDKKIMICANKLQTAIEIMDRIRKAYENLPFWIKPGILTYNKGEIEFANGSVIRACSTSSSAARGSSCNCLIIDEMAFIPKNIIDDFFASVVPIVSSSKTSKIIAVSTPNGAEGLYYELWQKSNNGENEEGWMPFRIHWWEVPGRDEKWKQQQIATIGIEKWKQEYECDFLTSLTKRLIPDDIIDKYRMELAELKTKSKDFLNGKKQRVMSPDETKLFEFTMWHEFEPANTYVASGDVAEGGGGDSSVLYVWDITDLREIRMCAMFESDKVSLTEFAFITYKILSLYNKPYYICERNGVGAGYIDMLKINYQYENLVSEGKNGALGVYSHVSVKSKACLWARDMMTTEGFGFKIYNKALIEEMSTFVKKDTKGVYLSYTALAGAHDDHIMAFIWLCYILQSEIIEKYYIVCETFKSAIGNTYARIVKPLVMYTVQDIKKVSNDPMYQEFLDFKELVLNKLTHAMKLESNSMDNMNYMKHQDIYFGGSSSEPTWNNSQAAENNSIMNSAQGLNPNNRMPLFFIQ